MNSVTTQAAIRQIQTGQLDPVYFLAGGDAFLEDHFISVVMKVVLTDSLAGAGESSGRSRRRNYTLDSDKPADLLAELGAYGLFQSRQIIVVRQVQRIAGKEREELLAYVAKPNPSYCLILVLEIFQPTLALFKRLASTAVLVDTRPPFDDKMKQWAAYHARSIGHSIEPEAMELLIDLAGDSLGHLVNEIDKVLIHVNADGIITVEEVTRLVGVDRAFPIWKLQVALTEKDGRQALRILLSLLEYGVKATQIVSAIATLFTELFFTQTHTTSEGVYSGLGRAASRRLGRMRRLYPPAETERILRELLRAEKNLKSTSLEPTHVLIPLLADICLPVS